ncbi:hypothetical protein FRC03_004000 [Tulasnella sp. 419]|nr:hypothetical protein FRC03_004000 [Tulasnella sp. 419]
MRISISGMGLLESLVNNADPWDKLAGYLTFPINIRWLLLHLQDTENFGSVYKSLSGTWCRMLVLVVPRLSQSIITKPVTLVLAPSCPILQDIAVISLGDIPSCALPTIFINVLESPQPIESLRQRIVDEKMPAIKHARFPDHLHRCGVDDQLAWVLRTTANGAVWDTSNNIYREKTPLIPG